VSKSDSNGLRVNDVVTHINGVKVDIYQISPAGNSNVVTQFKNLTQGYLKIAVRWKRESTQSSGFSIGPQLSSGIATVYDEQGLICDLWQTQLPSSSLSSSISSSSEPSSKKTKSTRGNGAAANIKKQTTSSNNNNSSSNNNMVTPMVAAAAKSATSFSFDPDPNKILPPLAAYERPLRSFCIRAGELLEERERYREAICYYQRACSLSRGRRANIFEEVNDIANLGLAYKRSGDYTSAYPLYRRALDMIEHADVNEVVSCGGGPNWTKDREETDYVYDECKNHIHPPAGRRKDLLKMVTKNMQALIEEMKHWNGTAHEYTTLIEDYNTRNAADCWVENMERQWTALQGGTNGLKRKSTKGTARRHHDDEMFPDDY
jgi:tetratricopeptide (TPR) repeat protein